MRDWSCPRHIISSHIRGSESPVSCLFSPCLLSVSTVTALDLTFTIFLSDLHWLASHLFFVFPFFSFWWHSLFCTPVTYLKCKSDHLKSFSAFLFSQKKQSKTKPKRRPLWSLPPPLHSPDSAPPPPSLSVVFGSFTLRVMLAFHVFAHQLPLGDASHLCPAEVVSLSARPQAEELTLCCVTTSGT